jgi:hypothetical protein
MITAKKELSSLQVRRVIFGKRFRNRLAHRTVHLPSLALQQWEKPETPLLI